MLCWWGCQLCSDSFLSQKTYLCHPRALGSVPRKMESHEKVLSKEWMWEVNGCELWKYLQVKVMGCMLCVRGTGGEMGAFTQSGEKWQTSIEQGPGDGMERCGLLTEWSLKPWVLPLVHQSTLCQILPIPLTSSLLSFQHVLILLANELFYEACVPAHKIHLRITKDILHDKNYFINRVVGIIYYIIIVASILILINSIFKTPYYVPGTCWKLQILYNQPL